MTLRSERPALSCGMRASSRAEGASGRRRGAVMLVLQLRCSCLLALTTVRAATRVLRLPGCAVSLRLKERSPAAAHARAPARCTSPSLAPPPGFRRPSRLCLSAAHHGLLRLQRRRAASRALRALGRRQVDADQAALCRPSRVWLQRVACVCLAVAAARCLLDSPHAPPQTRRASRGPERRTASPTTSSRATSSSRLWSAASSSSTPSLAATATAPPPRPCRTCSRGRRARTARCSTLTRR